MLGAPYFIEETSIRNQYLVRVVNKRDTAARFVLTLESGGVPATMIGMESTLEVGPLAEVVRPLIVETPRAGFPGMFSIRIKTSDEAGTFSIVREIEFVGPDRAGGGAMAP
jgi:hypothetical protein